MGSSTPTPNYVEIMINDKRARALVDTGAHHSCVNAEFVRKLRLNVQPLTSSSPKLVSANGSQLHITGSVEASISIGGYVCSVELLVIEQLQHNVILGLHMLRDNNAVIDVSNSLLSLANDMYTVPLIRRFSTQNILRTLNSVTVEPYHEVRLPVRLSPKYRLGPSIIEPLLTKHSHSIAVAKVYVEPQARTTICQVVNLTDKPFTLPARAAIATITPAELLSTHSTTRQPGTLLPTSESKSDISFQHKLETLTQLGFKLQQGELTTDQFAELVDILYAYRHVFAQDVKDLPGVTDIEYTLRLQPGTRPKRQRQYRYPPHMREVIRDQLTDWERAGIIREGDAKWVHAIVLVRKKSVEGTLDDTPKYRVCLDLRAINKVTVVESYPMPTFNSIVESFGDPPPAIFSVLDAISGFLQIPLSEESSKLLGIESDSKTYVMRRIPFGLVTSPFVYQKLMNKLLTGYQFVFACAYLDDCLIWSQNWSCHAQHLRLILDRISHSGLRLHAEKCKFAQSELRYLGMFISKDTIKPDPEKLAIIKQAKPPTNAKLLKSFLGLCGFYRRFIRGFAKLCQPFRALLKKNAPYNWTEEHTAAFERLKTAMTSAPVCLAIPNWHEKIVLITDSSRIGCGYIIANENDKGVQRVIAYGGRLWNKHESQWSVSELEMAGILHALETNSQYFIGRRFQIYTDHISNTWVQSLKQSQGRLYRWSLRLQSYQFDIEHLPGARMPADFLSRIVDKADPTAPDLEDDSHLVFALMSDSVSQQDTAQMV